MRQTPLLMLDDFGSQSATPWAKEKLFQLLNHRYVAKLPTVITTNLRLVDFEPRLRSRLADPDLVTSINIDVPDYRSSGNPRSQETSTLALHADKTFDNFDLRRGDLSREVAENLAEAKARAQKPSPSTRGLARVVRPLWLRKDPSGRSDSQLPATEAPRAKCLCRGTGSVGLPASWRSIPTRLRRWMCASKRCSRALFARFGRSGHRKRYTLGKRKAVSTVELPLCRSVAHRNYQHRVEVDNLDARLASRMQRHQRCTVVGILAPSYFGTAGVKKHERSARANR